MAGFTLSTQILSNLMLNSFSRFNSEINAGTSCKSILDLRKFIL